MDGLDKTIDAKLWHQLLQLMLDGYSWVNIQLVFSQIFQQDQTLVFDHVTYSIRI